jgi:hypothetical protein
MESSLFRWRNQFDIDHLYKFSLNFHIDYIYDKNFRSNNNFKYVYDKKLLTYHGEFNSVGRYIVFYTESKFELHTLYST